MKQFNKYNLGWFLLIAVSGVALYFGIFSMNIFHIIMPLFFG